jgi:eukaryotic-like serine/threonine-protein kinase
LLDCATIEIRRDGSGSASSGGGQPAPTILESGSVLRDRYVIEERLGQGGKGTVFKALDRFRAGLAPSQQYVAIKVLHELPGSRAQRLEALRRELQCAQLLSHENVIKVFDLDRDADLDFLTMEYLQGELLSSLQTRFHPQLVPRLHVWSIIGQIASGLQHAHDRGIVHADLKPQNIMITAYGEVRILDFGASHSLAEDSDGQALRSSSSLTLPYACCELLDGRTPDPRDDLYALACMTYELLTGAHPFQRRRASEARDLGVVPARPPGLGRHQWKTLARGLSWHRAGRSIRVNQWLKELKPRFKDAPPLLNLTVPAIPVAAARAPFFRTSVAFTLLVITAAIWLAFVRLAPGGKVSGQSLPATAARLPRAPLDQGTASLPNVAATTVPSYAGTAAARASIASGAVDPRVLAGRHFAEIRIYRPPSARGAAPIVWWTEAASAKPGVDYVDQSKVAQSFPAGKDSMSVFVKLLPRASENHSGMFYVAVADRADQGAQHVTHTPVRLPSNLLASD